MDKKITKEILEFRKVLMSLWNQNFAIKSGEIDPFNFEVDKAFSRVEDGLFESLVLAKVFDFAIERDNDNCYNQITIVPQNNDSKVLMLTNSGNHYEWNEFKIIDQENIFCYLDFFDWDVSGYMGCEYVRAILKKSTSHQELVGNEFLFILKDIEIFCTAQIST